MRSTLIVKGLLHENHQFYFNRKNMEHTLNIVEYESIVFFFNEIYMVKKNSGSYRESQRKGATRKNGEGERFKNLYVHRSFETLKFQFQSRFRWKKLNPEKLLCGL